MAEALPALGGHLVAEVLLGLGPGWTLLILVVLLVGAFGGLAVFRPYGVVRALFRVLGHTVYRLEVHGAGNVPAQGPALLVCNQVSYLDALLLTASQRRRIRLVLWSPRARVPVLRLLLRMAGVIAVDSSGGPRAVVQALRLASDALSQGEVVSIFAQPGVAGSDFVLPFHRGFEQILKPCPAPVVPVSLDHVWGSIFNYREGRFQWRWPQRLPYSVVLAFGEPLPATVTAVEARQAIQKLSADCARARHPRRRPVHRQFVRMAARHPFRSCFIDTNNQGKLYRYGEVLAGAWIFSWLLRPLLADEAMVGIWMPSSVGGAFANLALSLLGKTPVNLNYTSAPAVVQSAVRQCGIRHVLTARPFTSKVPLQLGPEVEIIYLEDFRKDVTTWKKLRAILAILLLPGFLLDRWVLGLGKHGPDDLATVIFSSGSTGDPKGIMLTQGNLAANTESVIQAIDPGPRDRLLGVLPFFHSFGFTVTLWVPLQVGASLVYYPDPRNAKEIGELCRKYRCTIYLTTPTFLRFCLRKCEPGDFSSLRVLICGAEKLPLPLTQEFQDKFGIRPLEGYGCTELSPVAAANVPDWDEAGVRHVGNKPGTIGQPIPGVAARVVDPETFQPLPPGQDGILLITGGNVMKGYLGRPEATGDAIRDGWYVTGDIAHLDEDGFIVITDRLARFSKIGGEMVP
ncbi:MAG: AMP-binding protein, partial [Planctomycetes bacterium]|nr:AMP-binding protein [Planctomycetota bacterium]